MKDYNDIVGTRISIYDILECINPKDRGSKSIKYKVKCHNCGHEKIVSRMYLSSVKCHKSKTCEKCRNINNTNKIYDFKIGQVYGKYKILEYLGYKNNSKPFRVKCMKCGWEGFIGLNVLSSSMKSKNTGCRHNSLHIGDIVNNGRYIIIGKFINPDIFKNNSRNPKYIVKCTKCNKLLYLPSSVIHDHYDNSKCTHKSYFHKEDFNENDYILKENMLESKFYKNNTRKKDSIMQLYQKNNYKEGDVYGVFTIVGELDKKNNKRMFLVECNKCHTESAITIDALRYSKKHNAQHCNNCKVIAANTTSSKETIKEPVKINNEVLEVHEDKNNNGKVDDNVVKTINARYSKYAISENKQVISDRINYIINNSDLFKKTLLDNAAKYIEENFEDDPFSVNEYIKLLINEDDFETKGLLKGGTIVEKIVEVPIESESIEAPVKIMEIEKKVPVYDTLTSPDQLYKGNNDVFTSGHHVINIIEQNKEHMAGHYLVHDNNYYIDDYGIKKLVDIAISKKIKINTKTTSSNDADIINVLMDKTNKFDIDTLKNNVSVLADPIFQSMVNVVSKQKVKGNSARKKFINGNKELINSVTAFMCFSQKMTDYNVRSSSLSEFNDYCEKNEEIGFNENPRYYSYLDRLNNEIINLRVNDFNNLINKFYSKNNIRTNIDNVKKIWISKKFLVRDNKTRKFESNNRVSINANELRAFIIKNWDCLNYAMNEYK